MAGRRPGRRGFGAIRKLPSKRFQASYIGPDLDRHVALKTFETRVDAEGWLAGERRLVESEEWMSPLAREARKRSAPTLAEYAPDALLTRRVRGEPLRPLTLKLYNGLLERLIYPTFGDVQMRTVKTVDVVRWHSNIDPQLRTSRAQAYALLRSLFAQAIQEGVVAGDNPCRIRGASATRRERVIEPLSPSQIQLLVLNTPERLRAAVLISAWCGLRFGEVFELRRSDLDLETGVVHVRRAVVRVDGAEVVGRPKSDAGIRKVAIPPHVVPALQEHLDQHVGRANNALLFATRSELHWTHGNFYKAAWVPAREAIGTPNLRFHDLRHTSAVLVAQTGATLAELMARLGHSTSVAALRYQHAAQGRDAAIAEAMSSIASEHTGNVVAFRRKR